jgi:hypothetical protein
MTTHYSDNVNKQYKKLRRMVSVQWVIHMDEMRNPYKILV